MSEIGYLSKRLRGAVDGLLCQSLIKRPHTLPSGRYVSLCFDDFPRSAALTGAPMLEQYGWRATYYVAGSFLDTQHEYFGEMFREEDLKAVIRGGHDIGCHTFDHINCADAGAEELASQRARNAAFLNDYGIQSVQSFAYPYGTANLACKRAMHGEDLALRGVKTGLNCGAVDFNMLKATGLQRNKGGILRALEDLDTLSASDGWLILFTHDVCEAPSDWGVTPEDFEHVLQAVQASGAEIVTVGEMVDRILYRGPYPHKRAA